MSDGAAATLISHQTTAKCDSLSGTLDTDISTGYLWGAAFCLAVWLLTNEPFCWDAALFQGMQAPLRMHKVQNGKY